MADEAVKRTITVADIPVEMEWTVEQGASAIFPPIRVYGRNKPDGREIDPDLLRNALNRFDETMLASRVNLASHGLVAVNRPDIESSPVHYSIPTWAKSLPLQFASPIVQATRLDTLSMPAGLYWSLGYAGLPRDQAVDHIPATDPVDSIMNRIQQHLALDPEAVQVEIFLQHPDLLAKCHFNWIANEYEASLASTLSRKNHHVPYTRVKKLVKMELGDLAYSVHVFALDVETIDHGLITPAVLVQYHSHGTTGDLIQQILAGDGLTEVQPATPPNMPEERSGRLFGQIQLYAKQPSLFNDLAGQYWLESQIRWASQMYSDARKA